MSKLQIHQLEVHILLLALIKMDKLQRLLKSQQDTMPSGLVLKFLNNALVFTVRLKVLNVLIQTQYHMLKMDYALESDSQVSTLTQDNSQLRLELMIQLLEKILLLPKPQSNHMELTYSMSQFHLSSLRLMKKNHKLLFQ